ncbi:MAG: hypothetical protein INH41_31910 [Myxococcaceae bacterium]|nr:hypothetical protein [Myxococcaceae bacterium]MCA3017013.1 hypothetical protein [Myxococcaceae bacterium]
MKRLKRWPLVVVAALALQVVRVEACVSTSQADAEARLAYLARRIDDGTFPGLAPGPPFDGEWKVGTLSMSSLAALNLAHASPETRRARAALVSAWAERMLRDDVRAFDGAKWGADALATLPGPEGHAGYLGHLAVVFGARCALTGVVTPLHAQVVDALARRLDASEHALIETYPDETYVPDNVAVAAGVAMFDACAGTGAHAATLARWVKVMRARWLDARTGVLVFAPGQGARGSGAAWNAIFLPFVDEAFAREQAERTWQAFGDEALSGWLAGVREWPRGEARGGDVDSGPLVFGVSPSATGFMLAAGLHQERLLATIELAGVSFGVDERRYLLSPLVGDAIILAAKTAGARRGLVVPVSVGDEGLLGP